MIEIINDKKIAYPKYIFFKNRIIKKNLNELTLLHVPIPTSISRVKKEMSIHGLLNPIVLLHTKENVIRMGTNRFLELKRQNFDETLCYKPISGDEAKFMQIIGIFTLRNHPVKSFLNLIEKENKNFERYGINIKNFYYLINENKLI